MQHGKVRKSEKVINENEAMVPKSTQNFKITLEPLELGCRILEIFCMKGFAQLSLLQLPKYLSFRKSSLYIV